VAVVVVAVSELADCRALAVLVAVVTVAQMS
jgi:hypothetical protein